MKRDQYPRLAAAMKVAHTRLDLDEVLLVVQRGKTKLLEAKELSQRYAMNLLRHQRACKKWRKLARKDLNNLNASVRDLQRQIAEKDAIIVRLQHEAKIGRLLDSSRSLESLAKAYLDAGEWAMIQKHRAAKEKRMLRKRLTKAEGGDANAGGSTMGPTDNTTAASASAGAAVVEGDVGQA
jgi:hypothetical protein